MGRENRPWTGGLRIFKNWQLININLQLYIRADYNCEFVSEIHVVSQALQFSDMMVINITLLRT